MCCDFVCLFLCAGWLAVGCCHPKFLVWFGFSSVFCTPSASASCSSSGVSVGGGCSFKESRQEETRREEKKGTLFIPKRL